MSEFISIRTCENDTHIGPVDAKVVDKTLILEGTPSQLKLVTYAIGNLTGILPEVIFEINIPLDRIINVFAEHKDVAYVYVKLHKVHDYVWISLYDTFDRFLASITPPNLTVVHMSHIPEFFFEGYQGCIDKEKTLQPSGGRTVFALKYPSERYESNYSCMCDNFTLGKK
jgi:hypothetical protein